MSKILLVEDNEMNRDMLSRRLMRQGYEVVLAMDGQQAVDVARASMPSVILMDISLPVFDGLEAARRLRGFEETKTIPIIALTAHAMPSDRLRCLEAGCDDYDTKPIDFPRLLTKLQENLTAAAEKQASRQTNSKQMSREK